MNLPFQAQSTGPAPGTTTQGSWGDFVSTVINGTVDIIQTVRNPPQEGWAGTTPLPNAAIATGSVMGLLVLAALVWIIVEA